MFSAWFIQPLSFYYTLCATVILFRSLDDQINNRHFPPNVSSAIESNNLSRVGLVPDLGQQKKYIMGFGVET